MGSTARVMPSCHRRCFAAVEIGKGIVNFILEFLKDVFWKILKRSF
jgi:hypothetical protein